MGRGPRPSCGNGAEFPASDDTPAAWAAILVTAGTVIGAHNVPARCAAILITKPCGAAMRGASTSCHLSSTCALQPVPRVQHQLIHVCRRRTPTRFSSSRATPCTSCASIGDGRGVARQERPALLRRVDAGRDVDLALESQPERQRDRVTDRRTNTDNDSRCAPQKQLSRISAAAG